MNFKIYFRSVAMLGLLSLGLPLARASLLTYTNWADFNAAIMGGYQPLQSTNFESQAAGTVISSGTTVEGTTFTYNLAGAFQLQVGSTFATTSGANYLGTTGDGAFLSGDQFTMTFAQPVQAVGLFVIGAGNNFAGDYTLSVAQGGVSNSFNTDSTFGTLADGGTVYFLGLIETDPGQSFASAVLSSVSEGGFPFNVDDIVTSAGAGSGEPRTVPDESSTFVLLLGVAVGLLALRRRWS